MTGILAKIAGMELAGNSGLTRWGTALAHFLWQGALLAVVAWVLMVLLKRATPRVRYAALVAVLGVMAACPILTFWLIGADNRPELRNIARIGATSPSESTRGEKFTKPNDRSRVAPDVTRDGATRSKHDVDSEARSGDSPASLAWVRKAGARLQTNAHWLVLVWCGGVVVLSIRLVAGIIGVERAKRYGVRPAAAIEAAVAALARRLRVSRPVRVLESTVAEVPTVVGWLRPFILLPASAMTGLTTAELEAVLAHELAHVRRHDYLVNVAQIVVETLLFYHPAVWWLSGRIRREREHCCDDWAVEICGNRVTYARALVALEGLRGPAGGLALAASGGSLRDRVLRLVGRPTPRCRNRSGWIAATLVVLVVAAAAGIGAAVTTRTDDVAPGEGDETDSNKEAAGPWTFHFRQLRATGFQVESRLVRKADGKDEQLTDVKGGVGLTLEELGHEKIEIEADNLRIWSYHPERNDLTDLPPNSPTKVLCRGNVLFRRGNVLFRHGKMSFSAKQMTLDLRRRRVVAEDIVIESSDGFRVEAAWFERNLEVEGDKPAGATETTAPDKLPAATWGEVHDGWQSGVRWKSGRVEHELGEKAWFEVVARNPGQQPLAVHVTKGEHWDVTLDAGNMLRIRIHGQDRENLMLQPGEERVLDVWRSRLSTDGLPEGAYQVAIRMPDDDLPQPPPLSLRLTAPSKPAEPGVPRDLKASAVPADDDKPVDNPETIVWGEPVLGLQAGVRFAAEGARRKLGETIETEVFLCNTNSHNVEIEYLHHTRLDFAPEIRDGDGREIEALLMVTGPKFNESRILPPNEPVLIGKAQFWAHWPEGGSSGFPSIEAPPGKYRYSTGLHIGGTNLTYVGIQLATGELPLELVAAKDDGDDPEGARAEGDEKDPAAERRADYLRRKRKQEIGRAVQRGVEYLKSQQNAENGGWDELAGFPGGISALCTLALLKTGVAPDDPAIEKALGRLRSLGEPKKTYSTALVTLVFCAADPERDRALIERNVKWLEQGQKRGAMAGAWAYPESNGDNSNTGFAVMALYEAEQANIKAAPETWRLVLDYWVRTQNADGSWGYKPGLPGTGSMTCSGISSLAAAAEVLGENDPGGAPRQALARGLNWMGGNFSVHANPGAKGQGWLLYYLKGVECVGRLTKEQFIGEHDWYREGAALLVDTQDKLSGFWKGQGHVEDHPQVGTSFALLFLRNGEKEKK